MSQRKGQISVNTKDILPIIKKWLYSEHDIFLRELISNGCDAISKRAEIGRVQNKEIPSPEITVEVDKKNKLVRIQDNGLGMTEQEVEKYLAQLAFSGAAEFVEKYKKLDKEHKGDEIIGKFGLGFYSAFMVADKVEVDTLGHEEGAKAVKWTCEGETDYTFSESDRKEVGTTITLHLNKESTEFLEGYKTRTTITKYCDFMLYPIYLNDIEANERAQEAKKKAKEEAEKKRQEAIAKGEKPDDIQDAEIVDEEEKRTPINDTMPIWKKDPTTLKDQDYLDFYRKQFPMDPEPLFWIHLKVDHPFNLLGVLYFPKLNPNKPVNEQNIRLYAKQVFVSDNIKDVIPEFLGLLKGSIDSSDIPLNVSRSALQGDPNIKKISNYIIKKVSESLKKLFKKDREKYNSVWEDIGLFVKYGCISDSKFDEFMRPFVVFKNSENKYMTLDEYQESIPENYKEKLKDKVIYFEKGKSDQALRSQLLSEKIQTLETDGYIDPHFTQHVEMKKQGEKEIRFTAIDAEIENILATETVTDKDMKIQDLFKKLLVGEEKEEKTEEEKKANPFAEMGKMEVEVKSYKGHKTPAYFKYDQSMKRLQQMTKTMGGQVMEMPVKKTLVVNPTNPLIQNALRIWETGENKTLVERLCHHVQDLATISSEGFQSNEEKDDFVMRSQGLIEELSHFVK